MSPSKAYNLVAMCLAIPGRVEEITNEGGLRLGRVNFGGVVKRVCLDYVPEVEVGDYTIVHVGFALSKIDEETAEKTLADFRAMGVLDEELAERGRAVCSSGEGTTVDLPGWKLFCRADLEDPQGEILAFPGLKSETWGTQVSLTEGDA
jgi:hydrogenase expression/formation protein HypC